MDNIETLREIGLTRNESLIYLTLLQTGTAKTGTLLAAAKLNSGRIYETLDALKAKGLVSESSLDGIRWFTAAPPSQLRQWIEFRKQDVQEDETRLEAIIPTLEHLRKATSTTVKTSTYFGIKGLRAALADAQTSLKEDDEILAMGITSRKDEKYNAVLRNWNSGITGRKIRYLFTDKDEHYEKTKRTVDPASIRVIHGQTPAAINIFGEHTIIIFNYDEESFIVIHSAATAKSFRTFFEGLWKAAKP